MPATWLCPRNNKAYCWTVYGDQPKRRKQQKTLAVLCHSLDGMVPVGITIGWRKTAVRSTAHVDERSGSIERGFLDGSSDECRRIGSSPESAVQTLLSLSLPLHARRWRMAWFMVAGAQPKAIVSMPEHRLSSAF